MKERTIGIVEIDAGSGPPEGMSDAGHIGYPDPAPHNDNLVTPSMPVCPRCKGLRTCPVEVEGRVEMDRCIVCQGGGSIPRNRYTEILHHHGAEVINEPFDDTDYPDEED